MKSCLFYGFNSLLKNNTSEDALELYKDRDTAFNFEYSGGTDEIKNALCNIQSMLK